MNKNIWSNIFLDILGLCNWAGGSILGEKQVAAPLLYLNPGNIWTILFHIDAVSVDHWRVEQVKLITQQSGEKSASAQ